MLIIIARAIIFIHMQQPSPSTRSLLQLPTPHATPLTFHWLKHWPQHQHHDITLITKNQLTKTSRAPTYQCTGLDYGCVIVGRVCREGTTQVLVQKQFGPVLMEEGLREGLDGGGGMAARLCVGRGEAVDCGVRVAGDRGEGSRLEIGLQAGQFQFVIRLARQMRLPCNGSFFKFYDKQQNCVGVSIYHQHGEFLEKLRKLKTASHSGFYVKLCFQTRQLRDIFLLHVLYQLGFEIPELDKSILEQQLEIKIQQSIVLKQEDENRIVRNTHDHAQQAQQNLDEQIFNLLFEASERGDNISLDLADAEGLFASSKRQGMSGSHLLKELKNSDTYSLEKRSACLLGEKSGHDNHNRNILSLKSENNKNVFGGINSERGYAQAHKSKSSEKKIINEIRNMPPLGYFKKEEQNLRTTISKLRLQIENLVKENKKLSQQNKKLKDQNMKLRYKQIRSNRPNHSQITQKSNGRIHEHKQTSLGLIDPRGGVFSQLKSKNKSQAHLDHKQKYQKRYLTTDFGHVAENVQEGTFTQSLPISVGSRRTHTHNMSANSNNEDKSMASGVLKPFNGGLSGQIYTRQWQQLASPPRTPKPVEHIPQASHTTTSKIVTQYHQTACGSQILPSQMIKMRSFVTASSHYLPPHSPAVHR